MQKKTEDAISNKSKVSLVSLFWEFFKIGLFTIGGGAAMLPQLQQTVNDKGWMDPDETLDAIALSQSLPGLIADKSNK
jgi:chromate transporter